MCYICSTWRLSGYESYSSEPLQRYAGSSAARRSVSPIGADSSPYSPRRRRQEESARSSQPDVSSPPDPRLRTCPSRPPHADGLMRCSTSCATTTEAA
jgi:hypothetical protein